MTRYLLILAVVGLLIGLLIGVVGTGLGYDRAELLFALMAIYFVGSLVHLARLLRGTR